MAVAGPLPASIGSGTKWQTRQGLDDDSIMRLNGICSKQTHQEKVIAARLDENETMRSTPSDVLRPQASLEKLRPQPPLGLESRVRLQRPQRPARIGNDLALPHGMRRVLRVEILAKSR